MEKFYDAVADAFERDFYSDSADPCIAFDVTSVWDILRRNIMPEDRVLEIGCGTGHWLDKISSEISASVYGIDFSTRMIQQAAERGHSGVVIAEASALPFRANVFDKVISPFNALNHCERYADAFAEIDRVLRPGGIALLMVDNQQRLIRRYWHLRVPNIKSLGGDPRRTEIWSHLVNGEKVIVYSHFYTREELIALLPGFRTEFVGIGILTALIPRFLRRNLRAAVRWTLSKIARVERLLGMIVPSRSAHLFVIGQKEMEE